MKHTIRFIILFFVFVVAGSANIWAAISNSDIIITVQPNSSVGNIAVTHIEENVTTPESGTKITIAASNIATGYSISKGNILVEKMVNPTNLAPSRAPGLTSKLTVYDGATANEFYFIIPSGYDGAYVTATFYSDPAEGFTSITSLSQISSNLSGHYELTADVDASSLTASLAEFKGILDGKNHTIYNLQHPLFSSTDGAIIHNLNFEGVNITSGDTDGDAGVITSKAKGATRIYNCGILPSYTDYDTDGSIKGFSGSSIGGSRYVGGFVGFLDGEARVINCFSYANITSGTNVGGIVGHNNVATKSNNLKTMVMNCMFYGDITGGSSKAPIYNGSIITNRGDANGVSNFNYFWGGASYVRNINVYNCALMAETRYLQRFEFFRHLLNSHRELAAWWATGNRNNKDDMMKWVMEPSQIGSTTPFPILKTPKDASGKYIQYPSVVNIDAKNATIQTERNKGGKLGTLTVNIQMDNSSDNTIPYHHPGTGTNEAEITTSQLTLNITDKDPDHFNFNYYKVQLPYYNDVGTKNYTGNRVVTGWKIVSVNDGGTEGTFTTGDDATANAEGEITATPYNFADRKSYAKDLYSKSGRIFNQGAYWDVPEGVKEITIEPYWAKAAYLADANVDVTYNKDMTSPYQVPNVGGGQIYTNGNSYNINGDNQKVYTSIGNATGTSALNPNTAHTVYDYAVVLVGNYHHYYSSKAKIGGSLPYTVTSIDLDGDNEPDYSYILSFNNRCVTHPARVDFLNIPGLGMAQKSYEGKGTYNFGIMQPKGWFEATNTTQLRFTQLEYDLNGRSNAPIIMQGGVVEQWVTYAQGGSEANAVTYYHVGGNVWFKEFHIGQHQDRIEDKAYSPHPPISVTGGDYDEFYLTGLYNTPKENYDDNAECYINGGRFGKVAGTGMQGIGGFTMSGTTKTSYSNGNIIWQIDNADIDEFYAGGINAAHIAEGNITTVISNSRVDQFCGGPKFGDMNSDKKVFTNATNCIFRAFFGAGYGGNSYNRRYPKNQNSVININWDTWLQSGGTFEGETFEGYKNEYISKYGGVGARIDYQFLPMSNNTSNVARLFVDYVSFSLATTYDVTSKLTGCTITKSPLGRLDLFEQCLGNFYGGGSLGMVSGPVKSTLTNCTVEGNAFGAGYSATLPSVKVMGNTFQTQPYYDENLGIYMEAKLPTTETYTWQHANNTVNSTATAIDKTNHILYTEADLDGLGVVTGKATLNIEGTTTVGGSVYGGGEESGVDGSTEVTVNGGTIGTPQKGGYRWGNVYGGGKGKIIDEGETARLDVKSIDDLDAGIVKGNTNITINGGTILHNVYGGGAIGSVGTFTRDATGLPTDCAANTGQTIVTINGGTIGHDRKDTGMVDGSSRGWEGNASAEGSFLNQLAWINSSQVVIGSSTSNNEDSGPSVLGSVYGGGENGHNYGNAEVIIHKGTIGQNKNWECGNVFGAGCGTDTYTIGEDPKEHHNAMAGIVYGTTSITVNGGNVLRNIYGGGAMGSVGNDADTSTDNGKTTVTINAGHIGTASTGNYGHVFGGPKGDSEDTEVIASVKKSLVTIDADADIKGSVFGGGENGIVKGDVAVNVAGGTIANDVYGGGALAHTNTDNWNATANSNAGDWANSEKKSSLHTTTVRLTGGTIMGEAYGGGLGQKNGVNNATTDIEAIVYGDVLVDLNGTTAMDNTTGKATTNGSTLTTNTKGCVVGQVFGGNNINGTPKGDVMVHVFGTQHAAKDAIDGTVAKGSEETDKDYLQRLINIAKPGTTVAEGVDATVITTAQTKHDSGTDEEVTAAIAAVTAELGKMYDVSAVYGGGNNAAYVPVTPYIDATTTPTGSKAQVVIEGCDYTSIQYVYGGGNAAPVPDTYVMVKGTKIIDYVFGGGNGTVSAADVGYDGNGNNQGNGNANTTLIAGTIHNVYGASNTNGDIRGKANIIKTDKGDTDSGCCDKLVVNKMYAAGKDADISGGSKTILGCMPEDKIEEYYGGAENANVLGDVELTITSGKFGKVFGGNKTSGAIFGHIFVNIEETGCRPIEIEELYGCGNEAPYSIYGYYDANTSGTGKPYYQPITSSSDPNKDNRVTPTGTSDGNYTDPVVNIISCTSIGKVFGGGYGSGAIVYGNPMVNINQIYGISSTNYNQKASTLGAIGDVYGGGNEAAVVGNTEINICTQSSVEMNTEPVLIGTLNTDYTYDSDKKKYIVPVVGANITDNVFGAGKGVPDDVTKAMVTGKCTVNMANGTVKKSVYGGGELSQVDGDTEITVSGGTIGTPKEGATVYGGATYGNVYGGGMGNTTTPDAGLIKGNTKITIQNTVVDANTTITPTILHNIYGGGAYGSVGTITRDAAGATYVPGRTTNIMNMPTAWARKSGDTSTDTGNTEIYINGGVIGTDGNENGMVFGSSRGDVATPDGADADNPYGTDVDENDRLAWVYDTKVVIGQSGSPDIRGSVYGSGENGHVFNNTDVQIHNGKVGIDANTPTYGTAEITDPVTNEIYTGANYPKRGNVYGGGCGEDDYTISGAKYFNPLAGIVLGNANVTIDGGKVVHNVYGAGALGSVGSAKLTTGGKTIIAISKGQVGDDGVGDGNVYGAARGKVGITQDNIAQVRETSVTISSTGDVKASVYGGGEAGNVRENTAVSMTGGAVGENVYGGGNLGYVGTFDVVTTATSKEYNFKDIEGNANTTANSDKKNTGVCTVTISGGKVGPDTPTDTKPGNVFGAGKGSSEEFECEPAMVYSTNVIIYDGTVNGTVYGGGEIGRVENNTVVTIGTEGETDGTKKPDIKKNVFAAGKGRNTHGYSALVRGDSKVTVQGKANVDGSVYGGGEIATVGRYVVVDNLPTTNTSGGECTVEILGNANIAGSVYGAGKGVLPYEGYTSSETPWSKTSTGTTEYTSANEAAYFNYITTLAIASDTHVTVKGNATVGGSVYGGGQKGFVQTDTDVKIQESCTIGTTTAEGNVFGGGLGDASVAGFAEAGRVKGNTNLTVSGGNVYGNIYGGGSLGDVGTIVKSADYNYKWTDDATADPIVWNNTGVCTVVINDGIIGVDSPTDATKHGNVFGAGKGKDDTYWCEKAMVYKTNVTINKGTVKGNVYGGGQIGRVENNAVVTIGPATGNDVADIKGNVFGAGAGLDTHGYSALVRGNATVTVQGKAQVGQSVYGGGETASVGRFVVDAITSLPTEPLSGGTCTVTVNGDAAITGNVYGACKGVEPADYSTAIHWTNDNAPHNFTNKDKYLEYLTTLALTSNTDVTIGGNATISGDVYGGGQRGITLGYVEVDVTGGTITKDVYGGGALADTNTSNWDGSSLTTKYYEVVGLTVGTSDVTGLYTKDGSTYIEATGTAAENTTYYRLTNTIVRLTGGTINGAAYGGGLGDADTPAYVYGDVTVKLNENKTADEKGCIVGKVFGCNNLNGTPKGHVQVYVYATQNKNASYTTIGSNKTESDRHDGFETLTGEQTTTYDVEAVYGGGNLSPYEPVDAYLEDNATNREKIEAAQTEVYILGCDLTSIKYVYGGGNAASAPATYVRVDGAYEIEELFAGGNGKDNYVIDGKYYVNPGANVGYTNYTELDGTGDGSKGNPYNCKEKDNAKTKANRQTASNGYMYGSGIAHLEAFGGYVHAAYGGSNEKGNIRYQAWSKYEEAGDCGLRVLETYGGGKNSEIDGEIKLELGCTTYMPEIFGGSKNADVNSDIVLNIANGRYDKVFGGNNTSGNIYGSITVNIKENGCVPINITDLYLGGYLAGYSIYGYYQDVSDGNKWKPRTKEQYDNLEDKSGITVRKNPRVNVISVTSIENIFGGGYQATVVGDPHVNVNMEQGRVEVSKVEKTATDDASYAFEEDDKTYVYKDGGKNLYHKEQVSLNTEDNKYYAILPIGTIGNVYGGGNEADIIGDTYVEIGTGTCHDENGDLVAIIPARNAATITGDVFGGGKGVADSFLCDKAMVGVIDKGFGSTHVTIENGTVNGNVYGGGQIGRVEHDTSVTIGKESDETNNPVVKGDVFGAGKGLKTHGYSALVRGKATVTVQGKAKVEGSVYGGGEIASVGRYNVKKGQNNPEGAPDWVPVGMPYSLYDETSESGNCIVVVRDNAIIGPETPMLMKKTTGAPDDTGHVFGAGKGVLPYEGYGVTDDDWISVPWRMAPDNSIDKYSETDYVVKEDGLDYKAAYLQFIETLALATETNVTISGNAFVKGSVYGGSMNGHVQHHTNVTIAGGQIGAGDGMTEPYKATDWTGDTTPAGGWKECAHWDYVDNGAPYDPLATTDGKYDYTKYSFVPTDDRLTSSEGGLPTATDGHTYYGNVFGGGSGVIPYAPGLWHRASGSVGGNSNVTITGGHILTSVYGGNEQTDVGTYAKSNPTEPATGGKCTITMSGGTVGVPLEHKENYPVTGHLFGAGKGDKRILFNTWTNVAETEVSVSGGTIYGNVYGGGEDGHVMGLAKTTVSEADAITNPTIIGTTGASGFDGDVFGGGQGSVTALTAGVVGGNVNLSIEGGTVMGSVYGGGRLASVGTFFALATDSRYGKMQDGDDHGNIKVNLMGGIINQNVFGGCMGATSDNRLGVSKDVTVNLNGYETTTGTTTTTTIVADDKKGCVVKGSIFGCNNLESSPQGDVLVHVYGTQKDGAAQIANTKASGETPAVEDAKTPGTKDAKGDYVLSSFDVQAVYGGGNMAAYVPTDLTNGKTQVVIDGCGRTSIGQVYGGGNAASAPATEVTVNGSFEIAEVFGGGNGKDKITINNEVKDNPGANVGFYDYSAVETTYDTKEKRQQDAFTSKYVYGSGKAAVNIYGGTIHRVFGGSNTKGNVRLSAITLLEEAGGCDFCVDEAYGGGKSAPMDAEAKLLMACIPGLKEVYGGAQAADVYDNVAVTITNGTFDRVFGGNNISGTIRGSITVNVEETGCRPVIIGELYGGGNLAGYSVYGYDVDTDGNVTLKESGESHWNHPQVNVKSFTSIGTIYGGGYGEGAVMVGNPTVNVSVAYGNYYNDEGSVLGDDAKTPNGYPVPSHEKTKIGAVDNVFGGGNAAPVKGNTNVNIGTLEKVSVRGYEAKEVTVGGSVEGLFTRSGAGTVASPYKYTVATGTAVEGTTYYEEKTVEKDVIGVDIRGNVYGGGNNAEVTGDTNVTIGQKKE